MKKIKVLAKCKICGKEYDPKESTRVFGSLPSDNGVCSSQCYTLKVIPQLTKEN